MPSSPARSQSGSISTSGCPMVRPGGWARICGFSNTERAWTKALRPASNRGTRSAPLNSRLMLLEPPMLPENSEPLDANACIPGISRIFPITMSSMSSTWSGDMASGMSTLREEVA